MAQLSEFSHTKPLSPDPEQGHEGTMLVFWKLGLLFPPLSPRPEVTTVKTSNSLPGVQWTPTL